MRRAALIALAVLAASAAAASAALPPLTHTLAARYQANVRQALELERDARSLILQNTHSSLRGARDALAQAHSQIATAADGFRNHAVSGVNPARALDAVDHQDYEVDNAMRIAMSGDNYGKPLPRALRDRLSNQLGAAIAAKKRALATITAIVDDLSADPGDEATQCSVTKPFKIYAIPDGYAGAYADVYPHVPKGAKNVRVAFKDAATGGPAPAQPFPNQTWKATVKGFLPDGRFDVRIDLTGTGFGAPDANAKNWIVVVTYDC